MNFRKSYLIQVQPKEVRLDSRFWDYVREGENQDGDQYWNLFSLTAPLELTADFRDYVSCLDEDEINTALFPYDEESVSILNFAIAHWRHQYFILNVATGDEHRYSPYRWLMRRKNGFATWLLMRLPHYRSYQTYPNGVKDATEPMDYMTSKLERSLYLIFVQLYLL